jgi:S1-C subfamily serine protease
MLAARIARWREFASEERDTGINLNDEGFMRTMQTFLYHYGAGISILVWVWMFPGFHPSLSKAIATSPVAPTFDSGLSADQRPGQGQASTSIVIVTESIGTAWPVAPGYLVTNNHVVSDADTITLIDQAGKEWAAWPILLDEMNDIAFLSVRDAQDLPPALPLGDGRAELDTRVFTVGFPSEETSGREPTRSHGKICGLNGTGGDDASYRTTVSVRHGNSGGPLINMTGEVVGVVRSMLAYRDTASDQTHLLKNASCAVKIDALKELLDFLPEKRPVIQPTAQPTGNPEALYNTVAHSVLRVVAQRCQILPPEEWPSNLSAGPCQNSSRQ